MKDSLLRADGARIAAGGSVLLEGLTVDVDGDTVGLLGAAWSALTRLLSREASLEGGTVRVLGVDAEAAVPSNHVGLSRAGVPVPGELRVVQFLDASARMTGTVSWSAARVSRTTLTRLGMAALSKRRLSTLNDTERRAVVIAQAVLGDPRVLVLETPLAGLDATAAASIRTLIERAREGRKLIVTAEAIGATGPEAELLHGAGRVAVLAGPRLVATGAPADVLSPTPRYVLWTTRAASALAAALAARGVASDLELATGDPEGAGRLVVTLGHEGTAGIVEASLLVSAPIVELLPFGVHAAPSHVPP